jgi:GNAT superfamily N-acetyltransferase
VVPAIRSAVAADEAAWRTLWDGYLAFYRADITADVTARTWQRIMDPAAPMIARVAPAPDGRLLGFTIAVLHETTWAIHPDCYLEDLFVAAAGRGRGIGRALIDDLFALARARGWARLYWHTRRDNTVARRLYDTYGEADAYVRYRFWLR